MAFPESSHFRSGLKFGHQRCLILIDDAIERVQNGDMYKPVLNVSPNVVEIVTNTSRIYLETLKRVFHQYGLVDEAKLRAIVDEIVPLPAEFHDVSEEFVPHIISAQKGFSKISPEKDVYVPDLLAGMVDIARQLFGDDITLLDLEPQVIIVNSEEKVRIANFHIPLVRSDDLTATLRRLWIIDDDEDVMDQVSNEENVVDISGYRVQFEYYAEEMKIDDYELYATVQVSILDEDDEIKSDAEVYQWEAAKRQFVPEDEYGE